MVCMKGLGEGAGESCLFWLAFGLFLSKPHKLPKVPSYLKTPALLFKQSLFNFICPFYFIISFIVALSIIISLEIGSLYDIFTENCSD